MRIRIITTPPNLPTIGQMAANAAAATGRILAGAAKGEKIHCSDEEAARRLAVCKACEHLRQSDMRCSKCGCYVGVEVVGKVRWLTEHCPIGKWQ